MSRTAPAPLVAALGAALVLSGCAVSKPGTPTAAGGPGVGVTSAAAGASTAVARTASTADAAQPTAPTTPTGAVEQQNCLDVAAKLSIPEQAGLVVLAGAPSVEEASDAIIETKAGGVLLTGPQTAGVAGVKAMVDRLRAASPTLLIAADQEGGSIQPLSGPGFDTIPAASAQAALGQADLRDKWAAWGKQLKDAGVQLNLAPVADLPTGTPIALAADRMYGTDPTTASGAVTAVAAGLQQAGVASAAGHFPGIGALSGSPVAGPASDGVTTSQSATLDPFRELAQGQVDAVVVSTATYTKIDPAQPAVFSAPVMRLLREDVRFSGVILSDDLAVAAVATVPLNQRGVAFLRAGGDMALVTDPGQAREVIAGIASAAQADPALAGRVKEAAANVLGLKTKFAMANCVAAKG